MAAQCDHLVCVPTQTPRETSSPVMLSLSAIPCTINTALVERSVAFFHGVWIPVNLENVFGYMVKPGKPALPFTGWIAALHLPPQRHHYIHFCSLSKLCCRGPEAWCGELSLPCRHKDVFFSAQTRPDIVDHTLLCLRYKQTAPWLTLQVNKGYRKIFGSRSTSDGNIF